MVVTMSPSLALQHNQVCAQQPVSSMQVHADTVCMSCCYEGSQKHTRYVLPQMLHFDMAVTLSA